MHRPLLFTLISSITTFVSLIVVTTTPWMAVMMIGYVARRGYYLAGGDLDLSLLAALILPAILHPVCLYLFPEPRAVFGPKGSRWVRTVEKPIASVVEAGKSR